MALTSRIRADESSETRKRYDEYIASIAWRRVRDRALRRACWQCNRCGGGSRLEVHHKTYERLGREHDDDLEVLCHDCHEGHHKDETDRTRLPQPLYVKMVFESIRARPFTSIFDLAEDVKRMCVRLKVPYHPASVASAIHVASQSLPKTSPFYSPNPVSFWDETPDGIVREVSRTEAVAILADVQERTKLSVVIASLPSIAVDCDDVARANRIRQMARECAG